MRMQAVLVALLITAMSRAATLIAVSWGTTFGQGTPATTYAVDSITGQATAIGQIGSEGINNVALRPDGTLYSAYGRNLLSIDPTTGAGNIVRQLTGIARYDFRDLAFASDGTGYLLLDGGFENGLFLPDILVRVNADTGVCSQIGQTSSFSGVQALAVSSSGQLYGWDINQGLLSINTNTGAAQRIGAQNRQDIQGMTFLPDGSLVGGRDDLFAIDISNGQTTLIAAGTMEDVRGFALPPATEIQPQAFSVFRGVLENGDLTSLLTSDDNYVVIRNGVTALRTESPITLLIEATCPNQSPTSLQLKVENHVSITGLTQRLDEFDFPAGQFVDLDARSASTTDTVVIVTAPNPARFVEQGTGLLRSRLRIRADGPVFTNTWRSFTDHTIWLVS